jgi:Bacterial regulatory proteins, gntR family
MARRSPATGSRFRRGWSNRCGSEPRARISHLLISGRLGPGDKLSLRPTAEALGILVMPIREAVSRLVADSAVEVTPSRAIRVPMTTRRKFRELIKVQIAVEGYAATEAATGHCPGGRKEDGVPFRRLSGFEPADPGRRHPRALAEGRPVIILDVRENAARLTASNPVRHAGIGFDIQSAADHILAKVDLPEWAGQPALILKPVRPPRSAPPQRSVPGAPPASRTADAAHADGQEQA